MTADPMSKGESRAWHCGIAGLILFFIVNDLAQDAPAVAKSAIFFAGYIMFHIGILLVAKLEERIR